MKFEIGAWRAAATSTAIFGMLSIGLAFFPAYSTDVAAAAALLSALGVAAAVVTAKCKSWWSQIAWIHLVFLFGLGIAVRAGLEAFGSSLIWPLLLVVLYLLAWLLPWLAPRMSARMLREQLAPETRIGRGCQTYSLSLIPGVGGLAFLVQRLTLETRYEKLDSLLIAVIASVVMIGLSQAFSQQYWEKKPWATPSAK